MHIVNLIVEIIVTCYCTALDMVYTCPIVYMYDVSLMISVTVNDNMMVYMHQCSEGTIMYT